MPNSRRRRPRKRSTSPRERPSLPALEAHQPWADAMLEADRLEARGDAAAVLEVMRECPLAPDGRPFWRWWRVEALEQIVALGDALPAWAVSRWLVAQSLQHLDRPSLRRSRLAFEVAVELRGGRARLPGADVVEADCQVLDGDWVYRQVHLYELGGLRHFTRRVASPSLVRRADQIGAWAGSSMGGYRFLGPGAETATWQCLATGETVDLLDLGTTFLEPGDTVIGRVVPIASGAMFESAPLRVPADVAESVAAEPAEWLGVLRAGCEKYGVGPIVGRRLRASAILVAGLHDFRLMSDVPRTLDLSPRVTGIA